MTREEIVNSMSLQDAIQVFKDTNAYGTMDIAKSVILKALGKMPQWIPVSERLPEALRYVNCTCHSLIDGREDWVVETIYVPQPKGSPYSDWGNIPMLNRCECEVIAWMYRDIPEPYKANPTGAESEG